MLKNKAIKVDLILVIVTILIPIVLILMGMHESTNLVPMFILLFLLFNYIDRSVNSMYNTKVENIKTSFIREKKNVMVYKTLKYSIILFITMTFLFFIGNQFSGVLEQLCYNFGLPELFVGILLGVATSIPELIAFSESQHHYKLNQNNELGVIEATNNLLSSNLLCLFIIQSIGIIIYSFM